MDEDEAALLAELRAISSNQSAASRFDDDNEAPDESFYSTSSQPPSPNPKSLIDKHGPPRSLSPDKKKKKALALPWKQPTPPTQKQTNNSNTTSATSLDRIEAGRLDTNTDNERVVSTEERRPPIKARPDSTPPWKKKKNAKPTKQPPTVDVLVAAPPPPKQQPPPDNTVAKNNNAPTTNTVSQQPSNTFTGERGGAAEDAELLALLKGISNNAASGSRFDDDDNTTNATTTTDNKNNRNTGMEPTTTNPPLTAPQATPATVPKPTPPTKPAQKEKAIDVPEEEQIDVVIVPAPKKQPNGAAIPNDKQIPGMVPSFAGERGRDANDANTTEPVVEAPDTALVEPVKPEKPKKFAGMVPPWKRKQKSKQQQQPDIVVAAPPPKKEANPVQPGFQSDLPPSTFVGERGGAAQDAELLALLRGVSSKSSADRFQDDSETMAAESTMADSSSSSLGAAVVKEAPPPEPPKPKRPTPPWKRKGKVKSTEPTISKEPTTVSVSTPTPPSYGIKNDMPSAFVGERGGAAEDAELLALLRGVSQQSGASRFDDSGDASMPSDTLPPVANPPVAPIPQQPAAAAVSLPPPFPEPDNAPKGEQLISVEEVPLALQDKKWKVRADAYGTLTKMVVDAAAASPGRPLDGQDVFAGLDDGVPGFVEDSNAVALDKALVLANAYAEHCRGAGEADRAAKIVSSLLKKNAFSSRPMTQKNAAKLVLKLMEVGLDGYASVHAIVQVLLDEGVASKKPKIVLAASNAILDAALHFGATTLPLASVTTAAPKILSHSNANVRETGLKIVAELCRVLGSKDALQGVIDGMKKAQATDLDALLAKQPKALPPIASLRSIKNGTTSGSKEDALEILKAGAKELEAQRFAKRPAVNLVTAVAKTDYDQLLNEAKWSQKVAAITLVLECGGEKPYKLVQPSSSANYQGIIIDMKKLLSHTHFAVCNKAMLVLAMLAEGVGEKLYPHLRPLLTILLKLSKDKKLTNGVSSCLDSFFGNVIGLEGLLEKDDAVPSCLDEKQSKNALVRATALSFLSRCVTRNTNAGPRGTVTVAAATELASLCVAKLADSDATVRKAAIEALMGLQKLENVKIISKVRTIVDSLETSNPRAYKTLTREPPRQKTSTRSQPSSLSKPARSPTAKGSAAPLPSSGGRGKTNVTTQNSASPEKKEPRDNSIPSFEDALSSVASLQISQWDAPDDDGGILEGLESSKWQLRQDAIKSLTAFIESGGLDESSSEPQASIAAMLVIVGEKTRGFKETNVNIMKAIMGLFTAVCEYSESKEECVATWIVKDAAPICTLKISDRKLSSQCKSLLTSLCTVASPSLVLRTCFDSLKASKSPVAHEEFLKWFVTFCNDFGAFTIGSDIGDIIPSLLEEFASTNMKVKREATSCFSVLHRHIGPSFKAVSTSLAKKPDLKDRLTQCFDSNPHDPALKNFEWPRSSLAVKGGAAGGSLDLDVPKSDLFANLPDDMLAKLGSKEGKASWKIRKKALDQLDSALKACSGLLDTEPQQMRQLVDLMRLIRERLSDTQINLRPTAARLAGTFLSVVDKKSQATLGKIIHPGLLNAAMNDIKKPMRDASLASIRSGITMASIEGEGTNVLALEVLAVAVVGEVNEAAIRAGGLPDVLLLLDSVAQDFPNLDNVSSSRGQSLGEKFAATIVDCLTSSKSDTRSAGSSLLEKSVQNGVIGLGSIRKATEKLKPASQRALGPLIAKISKSAPSAVQTEKENRPSMKESVSSAPRGASNSASTVAGRSGNEAKKPSKREANHGPQELVGSGSSGMASKKHKHPLESRSGSVPAASHKDIIWTEFPEEPSGSILGNLKRFWAPHISPSTASALFPTSGIRKQDDARNGCEVLLKATSIDRSNGTQFVQDQFGLILRWLVFALCSRETTTGLLEILAVVQDTLSYAIERNYELNDDEALILIPYLLEKASNAKGRFVVTYEEIQKTIRSESLLPVKRLGAVVCASMIDSAPHAKARALACQTCIPCVEHAGLAGISKKGVLGAAKFLSQETTMYRVSGLDLLEVVLGKMNGDIHRLVRICGPSLSDKGRSMLDERRSGRGDRRDSHKDESFKSPSRLSKGATPNKTPPSTLKGQREPELYDELPKLSLRSGKKFPKASAISISHDREPESSEDPFTFSLSARRADETTDQSQFGTRINHEVLDTTLSVGTGGGAAASLRARLMKIREKASEVGEENGQEEELLTDDFAAETTVSVMTIYQNCLASIRAVLDMTGPVNDVDPQLESCVRSLKIFHVSLSKQQNSSDFISMEQQEELRSLLLEHVDTAVDLTRRLVGFSLQSGDRSVNAGLLLPLLSLCLATLMAFFRDVELASSVSAEVLMLLIRETGAALLDPRLSSTDDLDEESGTQMVRATNKLAVQVATAAKRDVAFQALMTLQQQLASEIAANGSSEDNSSSRLSRVITKLFSRVIRTEESSQHAYDAEFFDMEALICFLEDTLASSNCFESCHDMVKSLVTSILTKHGNCESLWSQMDELEIDRVESALGFMVLECGRELDLHDTGLQVLTSSSPSRNPSSQFPPKTPARDVAKLVSTLGSAATGDQRREALLAIRKYKEENGNEELEAHLQQLSGTFREFIEDQLQGATPEKLEDEQATESVSDRIRNLRSRLHAAEVAVKTAVNVDEGKKPPLTPPREFPPAKTTPTGPSPSQLPAPSSSRLRLPVASSKIPSPERSNLPFPSGRTSAQSLRERLAARKTSSSALSTNTSSEGTTMTGRAAALRARLEAVKQQSKQT